jgi:hypothetical protein
MNPATLALLVQFIAAAIEEAPKVAEFVIQAKSFVSGLFKSDAISKEQQDKVHAHIDAIADSIANDTLPPDWDVEADPE